MGGLHGLKLGHDVHFFAGISVRMMCQCCKISISLWLSLTPLVHTPNALKAFLISSSEAVGGTSKSA